MSSGVSLKGVRICDSVAVDESKWKLLTTVTADGDTVFLQDAEGQKFRYRLADITKGNICQIKGGRRVIIPPSAANITSAAPLPNGDIVCLTADNKLKIFGQDGTLRRELHQKGSVIATHNEDVLVLEDTKMITFLNPDTYRYQDAIKLGEKVVDITPVSDDLILACLRSGATAAILHHPADEGSTQNFTMTPIPAKNFVIKRCLRGMSLTPDGNYPLENFPPVRIRVRVWIKDGRRVMGRKRVCLLLSREYHFVLEPTLLVLYRHATKLKIFRKFYFQLSIL